MNVFEKMIAAVSPERAVKRAAARRTLSAMNSGYGNYGANRTKKSMIGWMASGGSAKEDIEDNLDVLRRRSRDAFMGVPLASAALKTLRTNVIAGGLIPSPQIDAEFLRMAPEQAEQLQAQILREFALWADVRDCDADGMDNFYGLQQLAFLNSLMNGDAFAVLPVKDGRPKGGQPYGLRMRLIEADRVCSPGYMDRLTPGIVQGRYVRRLVQGVETDAEGRVEAFWIADRHPHSYTDISLQQWKRVEVCGKTGRRNILHIMSRERAGQLRGVPFLAPVLESLKQMGRYAEAEIDAAAISADFTVFLKTAYPENIPFEAIPPDQRIDEADKSSVELGPGAIWNLAPGEEAQFADPKHPNSTYGEFMEAFTKQISAAVEIPSEVLFKRFNSNFSSARGALNEFWRVCEMYRTWFADDFCQPVFEEWFAEAVARGRIHAPGFFSDPAVRRAYTKCKWNGPARTALNPSQEVEAAIKRIGAGISNATDETAQMTGGDYNRNIRLRFIEAQRKREVDDIAGPPVEMMPNDRKKAEE